MKRIVVFGGTFDPVHQGHLRIIDAIERHISPHRILVIPCGQPPHRAAPIASGEHRSEMLRLACNNRPSLVVDDRELRSDTLSYSYLTLKDVQLEYPDALLYMTLGWDSLASFTRWHRWQDILDMSCLLVVGRSSKEDQEYIGLQEVPAEIGLSVEKLEAANQATRCIVELPFDEIDCSSTEVREALRFGASAEHVLKPQVIEYIKKYNLYQS